MTSSQALGNRARSGWLAAAALLAAHSAAATPADVVWRRVSGGGPGSALAALASDPRAGALALGDERGVAIVWRDARHRQVLRRGPVVDLAFLSQPAGSLLAATQAGLFHVAADGRTRTVAPAPGEAARAVQRIAVSSALVAVAAGDGVHVSADALRWQRPSPNLPDAPATGVALRDVAEGVECFAVIEARLWSVRLRDPQGALHADAPVRHALPIPGEEGGPVDVAFGVGGADVVAVLPAAFAVRTPGEGAFRLLRPVLPPGVRARRLVSALGRLWLATDRGLLEAESLGGPWARAQGPAGSADVTALVSAGSLLYAAADGALLEARPGVAGEAGRPPESAAAHEVAVARERKPPPAQTAPRLRTPEGDPPIEQVHRAALAYLDLGAGPVAAMRRGVARRGWLPLVSFDVSRAEDSDRSVDRDETFTSGVTHLLVDRGEGSARDFETSLTFTWNLGDLAYHPEQIDIAREAREVIKLRDDVLDEVTQLYFERRRALAELAARPDASEPEQLALRLRAAELAAGIDAWTGGWFSRVAAGVP
jgi:hypothetical protein